MKLSCRWGMGLLSLVLCFLLGFGLQRWWFYSSRQQLPFYGTVLDEPRPIPSFSFEGTQGTVIDNAFLKDHWTFLFFGFTHCASVCPVTMAELAKMVHILRKDLNISQPNIIMVTLDPARDSIDRMRDYVHAFDPAFIGARGGLSAVRTLAHQLGIAYTQVKSDVQNHPNDYSIEHSGAVILVDPRGNVVAFFTPPHHAEKWVDDYRRLSN